MTAHLSLGLSGSLDSVEFLYSPDPGDSFMAAPLERRVAPNKLFCCTEAKFELQKFSHENNLTSLQNFQPLFRFFFLSRRKLKANKPRWTKRVECSRNSGWKFYSSFQIKWSRLRLKRFDFAFAVIVVFEWLDFWCWSAMGDSGLMTGCYQVTACLPVALSSA